MHGGSIYQDANGAVVAEGRWRHGKPWDGVCWVPTAGDAGSWGGLGRFERREDGRFVESLPGRR